MFWPTLTDYTQAIQSPAISLCDPELQQAETATDPLGLPRVASGSFATVFRLDRGDQSWAVKCFFRNIPERRERYRKISEAVQHASVPYLIPCDYQDEGIYIGSDWYPILKMPWVEGVHLNQFLVERLDHPEVLRNVARAWLSMLRGLRTAGIAHGDLQHGNVLIVGDRLRLVDYDGMYVPALEGAKSLELGHPEYQHPRRGGAFGSHLDRFPGLVVYTALRALTYEPRLWTPTDNGENLLFRQADYGAPSDSKLFAALRQCPQDEVRTLAEQVQKACSVEPDTVPDVLELADPDEVLICGRSSVEGLPSWLAPLYPDVQPTPAPEPEPEPETRATETIEQAEEREPVAAQTAAEEPAAPSPWWRDHLSAATAAEAPGPSGEAAPAIAQPEVAEPGATGVEPSVEPAAAGRKSRTKLYAAAAVAIVLVSVLLVVATMKAAKGFQMRRATAQIEDDLRSGRQFLAEGQDAQAAFAYRRALDRMEEFRRDYGSSDFDERQEEAKRSLALARARHRALSDLAVAAELRQGRDYAKARATYQAVLTAARAAQQEPADDVLQRVIAQAEAALQEDDIRLGSPGYVQYGKTLKEKEKVIGLGQGVTLELVWIPPGKFLMGSPGNERHRDNDEGPQHGVQITTGFWMGKYEVTQEQWEAVMGGNPSHFEGNSRRPVESVSWNDCQHFLKELNSQFPIPNSEFRLPTEVEWEYACRAGATTRFYWGDDPNYAQIRDYAWSDGNSGGQTHPVGEKKPNAWGLYDMSGNVWEWCHDWYGSYGEESRTDPKGPSSGSYRVLRGGSWGGNPEYCRAANRSRSDPSCRSSYVGFRIVSSPRGF